MLSQIKESKKNHFSSLYNLRNKLTIILIVYFIVSIGSEIKNQKEFFPFFSWFLFSDVPNTINQYNLIVHENNGQKLNPPLPFAQTNKFTNSDELVKTRKLISKIGENYVKGNQEEVKKLRFELERRIFDQENVQYELVSERYNPIEKWQTGRVKTKSLTFFRTGEFK